ncbi:MAG: TPM domain-containing protein [Bacteroidales bacterium]|nr:TPM domain-containing protein [Bacteroidales bacterium]
MTKTTLIFLRFSFLSAMLIFSNFSIAEEFSIKQIKDIKSSTSNSYVSNQDNVLSTETYHLLNQKLDSLDKATTAQIAIVALKNTGQTDAREISMELFKKWSVGQKGANNGLILVLIVDRHEVFIRTGYGLEGAITDAKSTHIINTIMAPYFKKGDWDNGMIAGVDELSRLIIQEYITEGFAKKEPKTIEDFLPFIYIYIGLSIFLLILAIINIHNSHKKFDIELKEEKIKAFSKTAKPWYLVGILFPIVLIALFLWYKLIFKPRVRYKTVICSNCNNKMHRLNEKDDDEYLTEKQIIEENVKSRDYDVWLCDNCGTTDIFAYDNSLTQYTICPFCSGKTMYLVSDSIVRLATQSKDGLGRKTYICKNCKNKTTKDYVISKDSSGLILGGAVVGSGLGRGGGSFGGGSFGGGLSGGGGGSGSF